MTAGELYARARVAFVAFPSARLYTRRDTPRMATRVLAERTVDGRLVRVSVCVADETLFRDDVQRVERLVALLRGRYRLTVGMLEAARVAERMGARAADGIAAFERVRVELGPPS